MVIQAPKGTKDILPSDIYKWQYIEEKFRKIASEYCCKEIRTPIFEHTELFIRGVGETTDVVQKEMYTFKDKGGRSITLKPEGTSPAVRAFIQNGLFNDAQPTKLYYFTPAFRYEKMQKGRLRQHHQFGVEIFGSNNSSVDAEVISLIMRVYKEFGIDSVELNINNMGCPKCRKNYNKALEEYLTPKLNELCTTCKSRFGKNTLRILDCKEETCKEIVKDAPLILDYVCDECSSHFESLKKYLEAMNIEYKINPHIVRGLDYYSKTVFEVIDNGITLCGGGRYDYLIKECGGPDMPAVGFGMGMERLLMTLEEKEIIIPEPDYLDLYFGYVGKNGKLKAISMINELRIKGIKCDCDHMDKSVKAQLKYSNKMSAKYTIILGEDELTTNKANIKRMSDGQNFNISISDISEILKIVAI